MSTSGNLLEAQVWLEVARPDLPAGTREAFYEAVDQYYQQNPIAERDAHFLSALQEDHEAFPRILGEIMGEDSESSSA